MNRMDDLGIIDDMYVNKQDLFKSRNFVYRQILSGFWINVIERKNRKSLQKCIRMNNDK